MSSAANWSALFMVIAPLSFGAMASARWLKRAKQDSSPKWLCGWMAIFGFFAGFLATISSWFVIALVAAVIIDPDFDPMKSRSAMAVISAISAYIGWRAVRWQDRKKRSAPAGKIDELKANSKMRFDALMALIKAGVARAQGLVNPPKGIAPIHVKWGTMNERDLSEQTSNEPSSKRRETTSRRKRRERPAYFHGVGHERVRFDYMNGSGVSSSRTVVVTEFDGPVFTGWCELRDEERSFRLDRIEGSVVSMETGEVMLPEEWAERFCREWLEA